MPTVYPRPRSNCWTARVADRTTLTCRLFASPNGNASLQCIVGVGVAATTVRYDCDVKWDGKTSVAAAAHIAEYVNKNTHIDVAALLKSTDLRNCSIKK
jgi:hypothetical protein